MASVRLTRTAIRDLNEIWDFVAEEDPVAASQLTAAIERRCSELAETPFIGRVRAEFASDVRSLLFNPFIVFYRIVGGDAAEKLLLEK